MGKRKKSGGGAVVETKVETEAPSEEIGEATQSVESTTARALILEASAAQSESTDLAPVADDPHKESVEDVLRERMRRSSTPDEAQQWQRALERYQQNELDITQQQRTGWVRVVLGALLILGGLALAFYSSPEVGLGVIGTGLAMMKKWSGAPRPAKSEDDDESHG